MHLPVAIHLEQLVPPPGLGVKILTVANLYRHGCWSHDVMWRSESGPLTSYTFSSPQFPSVGQPAEETHLARKIRRGRASPAKRLRDLARQQALYQKLAAGMLMQLYARIFNTEKMVPSAGEPCDGPEPHKPAETRCSGDYNTCRSLILLDLARCVEQFPGRLGEISRSLQSPSNPNAKRQRDIFPLGHITDASVYNTDGLSLPEVMHVLTFVNSVITALNWLYGCSSRFSLPPRASAAQRAVHENVFSRCVHMLKRLGTAVVPDNFVRVIETGGVACLPNLVADLVDNIGDAGKCDPLPRLPSDIREVVTSESKMFPYWKKGLSNFSDFHAGDRSEYIKLVGAQLRCNKVSLVTSILGGGTVFAVSKSRGRLREVWHGRRVSQAAVPPPRPRMLASPSAFLALEASTDSPLRASKRDGKCAFDQLLLPRCLRKFMARHLVHRNELVEHAGFSHGEIDEYVEPGHSVSSSKFWPIGRTWGMGFSWSSYISQETFLSICDDAGPDESMILSADVPTPMNVTNTFGVATDDVMIFSNEGPGVTTRFAEQLDTTMSSAGIERHVEKDITDSLCTTCVGVELVDGLRWEPPARRLWELLLTTLTVCTAGVATPGFLRAHLGTLQWFDLLVRPKLSVYDQIYRFTMRTDEWVKQHVPAEVLTELLVAAVLAPFWTVDMRKPYLPCLFATDASSSFGFGGAVCKTPVDKIKAVARLCVKSGDHVLLGCDDASTGNRIGKAHNLGLNHDDFQVFLCARRKYPAHINLLEGSAYLLSLKWLLRSKRKHGHRVVFLLDSQVLIGAASKGRSSSRMLNQLVLRKAAALVLAGDITPYHVFIPSKHNPADLPSRGVRSHRRRVTKVALKRKPQRKPRSLQRLDDLERAYARLRETGMLDSLSSSISASSCSDW